MRDHMSDRDVVKTYCTAWLAGDTMAVLGMYHPDLTLIWPGRHHLAGTHVGQAASIDALLRLQAITNRQPIEVVDVVDGNGQVTATVVERWTNDDTDRTLDVRRDLVYTVVDGKLHTCRVDETDQASVDAWIDAARSD